MLAKNENARYELQQNLQMTAVKVQEDAQQHKLYQDMLSNEIAKLNKVNDEHERRHAKMTQDHLDTLNAQNIKHAAKVQELTTVNDQQNQNHLKAQEAKQANFDDEKNAHMAELNNLRNEFKKRDAQYVKDLEELNSKNAAYVRQLQTNYSSELNKRDEALAVLNNNYQKDLMAYEKKHADFLRHEQAKF